MKSDLNPEIPEYKTLSHRWSIIADLAGYGLVAVVLALMFFLSGSL